MFKLILAPLLMALQTDGATFGEATVHTYGTNIVVCFTADGGIKCFDAVPAPDGDGFTSKAGKHAVTVKTKKVTRK